MKRVVGILSCLLLAPSTATRGEAEPVSGTTVRVSVAADGNQASRPAYAAAVSADGSIVAFCSEASLAPRDTNFTADVYVRNLIRDTTRLVSLRPDGRPFRSPACLLGLSPDGRTVTFLAGGRGPRQRVFVRVLGSGETRQVAHGVFTAAVSPGARWLAYAGTEERGAVRLLDLAARRDRAVIRVTGPVYELSVADTGDVAFATREPLSPLDRDDLNDVYVWTRSAREVTLASRVRNRSVQSTGFPAISATGDVVAFWGYGWSWGVTGHFVWERSTDEVSRLSHEARQSELFVVPSSAVSPDGRFVAFSGAVGQSDYEVYLIDRSSGLTEVASANDFGMVADDDRAGTPAVSPDGRFVAFTTNSPQLVPRDTNGMEDVFLRDRSATTPTVGAPDLMARGRSSTEWVGAGVIDPTPRGRSGTLIEEGRVVLVVRNVGTAEDVFRLRGSGSTAHATVTYRSGGIDVTDAIVGGTFSFRLATGSELTVDLRVQTDPSPYCDLLMKLGARSSTVPWKDLISIDVAGCAR
jgi:hypothetical protein